ncbi:hypothetical protein N431DRAFT_484409 [Stipitochalara longipes BDJ]|nr:hypothetical protein N431DRAFT_484409 [Stipitochalara longipes BDJ]
MNSSTSPTRLKAPTTAAPPLTNLWEQAYEELKNDKDKRKRQLVQAYEEILLSDARSGVTNPAAIQAYKDANIASKREQIVSVLNRKLQYVEDNQVKLRMGSKEIEVSKHFDSAVTAVLQFKDIVSSVVSAEPHAAMAWTGVCLVLPLLLNHKLQRDAAIEGVDVISSIITRSKVIDETHADTSAASEYVHSLKVDFAKKRKKLYATILEYEARVVCHFSDSKSLQIIKDIFAREPWKPMLADIRKQEEICKLAIRSAELEDENARQNERDFQQWISPVNSYSRHIDIRRTRLANTGDWLFEKPEFKSWQSSTESVLLWILGGIGVGKSTLVSKIVDCLPVKTKQALAFFYCDSRSTTAEILGSILWQIMSNCTTNGIYQETRDDFLQKRKQNDVTKFSAEESAKLIIAIMASIPMADIIIDGIDEIEPDQRFGLLQILRNFQGETTHPLKIIICGRNSMNVKSGSQEYLVLHLSIADNQDDIQKFVKKEVAESSEGNALRRGSMTTDFQADVAQALLDGAEGMFQWVKVQLNLICDSDTIRGEDDIRDQLKNLPKGLDDSYTRILKDKIETLLPKRKALVMRAFCWLLCAKRELSTQELLAAACVGPDGQPSRISPEDLVGYSSSLIIVDATADRFRIAHASITEFLRAHATFSGEMANTIAAERCMVVWLAPDSSSGVSSDAQFENGLLHHYSATFLVDHLECVWGEGEVASIQNKQFRKFFSPPTRLSASKPVTAWVYAVEKYHHYVKYQPEYRRQQRFELYEFIPTDKDTENGKLGCEYWGRDQVKASILFIAAYFGLLEVLKSTLPVVSSTLFRNVWGSTPLQIACKRGNFDAVKLLLERQMEIDKRELQTSPTVDLQDKIKESNEIEIDGAGDQQDQGEADVAARTGDYRFSDPVHAAAAYNHCQILEFFLALNPNLGPSRALTSAATEGHLEAFELLYNLLIPSQQEAFLEACSHGHNEIVQFCISSGIDINCDDAPGFHGTALRCAAENGSLSTVELLVQNGADLNSGGKGYGFDHNSPLEEAAQKGNVDVIIFLLDAGADTTRIDMQRFLRHAIYVNNSTGPDDLRLAQTLFERFPTLAADFKEDAEFSGELLKSAVACGYAGDKTALVRFFLDKGADPNKGIGAALESSRVRMIQLLTEFGGTLSPENLASVSYYELSQNALHLVAHRFKEHSGVEEVVEWLLERGQDPWGSSPSGIPLQIAVRGESKNRTSTFMDPQVIASFKEHTPMPRLNLEVRFTEDGRIYFADHKAKTSIWAHHFSGYPISWIHAQTESGGQVLVDNESETVTWRDREGKFLSTALVKNREDGTDDESCSFVHPITGENYILDSESLMREDLESLGWSFEKWCERGYDLKRWN